MLWHFLPEESQCTDHKAVTLTIAGNPEISDKVEFLADERSIHGEENYRRLYKKPMKHIIEN